MIGKIDNEPHIVMACCVLHNYYQLMGMDAVGCDRVERMQDMRHRVQANCIPCY
jgi:hypothetical protein